MDTESIVRDHLLKTYGSSDFTRVVVDALAPKMAQMIEAGEDDREVVNLLWMNFSGGDTADLTVKRIYADVIGAAVSDS